MTALTDAEIQDIRESYDLTEWGTIANPGKFEGQPLWVAVAYEDSGHGCWEHAYSDGNGGACGEYLEICPGTELDLSAEAAVMNGPALRKMRDEGWLAWQSLGISPETRALILHTDSQGGVSGEEATKAELDTWLDKMEEEEAPDEDYAD